MEPIPPFRRWMIIFIPLRRALALIPDGVSEGSFSPCQEESEGDEEGESERRRGRRGGSGAAARRLRESRPSIFRQRARGGHGGHTDGEGRRKTSRRVGK